MNPQLNRLLHQTRRHFLRKRRRPGRDRPGLAAADGTGASANVAGRADPLAPRQPHFAAKAKRVIYLHMSGSPPHLDLFDYKPELVKRDRPGLPGSVPEGHDGSRSPPACRSCWARRATFAQHGKGGHLDVRRGAAICTSVADEMCVIKSMNTDQFNHAPAELLLYTGSPRSGPAVAWARG